MPFINKKITVFKSFDEAEEYRLRNMASHTYTQRMENLAALRRSTYKGILLPDGNMPPLKKKITVIYASYK
jgi:hypothetical protein